LDEHHPKATRTLFVGNLEKDISNQELRERFLKYGDILVSIELPFSPPECSSEFFKFKCIYV
jgi:RNA recognition motif-containing protein